jgi:hypothetical protein
MRSRVERDPPYNQYNERGDSIMPKEIKEEISALFRFRPWPPGDPIAPWVLSELDKAQLIQLAQVGLELNQAILKAQMEANAKAIIIIGGKR